jgi:hypothetical protein
MRSFFLQSFSFSSVLYRDDNKASFIMASRADKKRKGNLKRDDEDDDTTIASAKEAVPWDETKSNEIQPH